MSSSFLWLFALAILVVVISFTSYLRLSLRHLSQVASRAVFEREGTSPGRIRLDREWATLALSACHATAVGLFALTLTAFRLSGNRRPTEALLEAVVILLVSLVVFDQLIPFAWLAREEDTEATVRRWKPAIRVFYWLALPLTFPLFVSASLRSLGEPEQSEEESNKQQEAIQDLIQVGEQEGLIEKSEGEMIQSVVEFGDKTVREVMTPRPEIVALDAEAPLEELRRLFRETKHRRLVVYAGQLDQVQGVVNVVDLLEPPPEEQTQITVKSLISPVRFVPETKKVSELLKELQQETLQMAIIIDEYGAVAGLVTIEDLVEEIVGEIRDGFEPHEDDIIQESKNSYLVAGHTEVSQLANLFHAPVEDRDYNTVSGLIISKLGRVPHAGERVEKGGLDFEVLESNPRTILRVRVVLPNPATKSSTEPHGT